MPFRSPATQSRYLVPCGSACYSVTYFVSLVYKRTTIGDLRTSLQCKRTTISHWFQLVSVTWLNMNRRQFNELNAAVRGGVHKHTAARPSASQPPPFLPPPIWKALSKAQQEAFRQFDRTVKKDPSGPVSAAVLAPLLHMSYLCDLSLGATAFSTAKYYDALCVLAKFALKVPRLVIELKMLLNHIPTADDLALDDMLDRDKIEQKHRDVTNAVVDIRLALEKLDVFSPENTSGKLKSD